MDIQYRNATINDLDFLVESRMDFIQIYNTDTNYNFIKNNVIQYFEKGFREEQFDIILAEFNDTIIGTGIIFYYDSVPSTFNPCGKNAYITSMFVQEEYRRQKIATNILDKLIYVAKLKNYYVIFLNESEMGKPVYEKYGFKEGKRGMFFKLQ